MSAVHTPTTTTVSSRTQMRDRVINLASGVRWERLTPRSDPEVEFLHVVYPVGAESCPPDALVTHSGREYGYVTSGRLGVRVGFDEYELGPGTSIVFDSSSPHRLWAIGGEPVHAVWVVIGRAADPRGGGETRRAVLAGRGRLDGLDAVSRAPEARDQLG